MQQFGRGGDSGMQRVGIVGTNWGLMHLGAFREAGAEVVALCGRDLEKTRSIAARESVKLGTASIDDVIEASDVVVVASPPHTHGEYVRRALSAGRHVLCEKPIARSALEAEGLASLASEVNGLVTAVNFPMRWLPPVAALRDAIHTGRLGSLRSVAAVITHGFGVERGTEDGLSVSGELGGASHPVDAAFWLARGEPDRVTGVFPGGRGGGVSLVASTSRCEAVSVSFCAGHVKGIEGSWRLVGSDAESSFEAGYYPDLGGWSVGPVRIGSDILADRVASTPGTQGSDPWYQAHVALAKAFIAAVNGEKHPPLPGFLDGARTQRVLVAAADSASRDRCAEI